MDDQMAAAASAAQDQVTIEAPIEADPSAVVDALEKYLEGELPMASFLIVQTACAHIRKHLQ